MNIEITLPIPKEKYNKNEQRWSVQNEIFDLLLDDDGTKRENWRRFCRWVKQYRIQYRKEDKKIENKWKKESRGELKYIRPVKYKSTLAYFTAHLDIEALYYVLSVMKDKKHRGESTVLYLYTLSKSYPQDGS